MCIQALKQLFAKDRGDQVSKKMFNEILYEEWIAFAKQHDNMLLRPGESWTIPSEAIGAVKNHFEKMVLDANPQFDAKMLDVVRAVELNLIPRLLDNKIELEMFSVPWDKAYRKDRDVAHATPLEHS
jgi:hypothetical protein